MKRLNDFTDISITTKVLPYVLKMTSCKAAGEARTQENATVADVIDAMVEHETDAAIALFAFLNEMPVEEYKRTATVATMMHDIFDLYADNDLMELFGLRVRRTQKEPSASATEITKASEKDKKQ
jgi:hypothetical protein